MPSGARRRRASRPMAPGFSSRSAPDPTDGRALRGNHSIARPLDLRGRGRSPPARDRGRASRSGHRRYAPQGLDTVELFPPSSNGDSAPLARGAPLRRSGSNPNSRSTTGARTRRRPAAATERLRRAPSSARRSGGPTVRRVSADPDYQAAKPRGPRSRRGLGPIRGTFALDGFAAKSGPGPWFGQRSTLRFPVVTRIPWAPAKVSRTRSGGSPRPPGRSQSRRPAGWGMAPDLHTDSTGSRRSAFTRTPDDPSPTRWSKKQAT
jgi:hypothetical protein